MNFVYKYLMLCYRSSGWEGRNLGRRKSLRMIYSYPWMMKRLRSMISLLKSSMTLKGIVDFLCSMSCKFESCMQRVDNSAKCIANSGVV